MWRSGPGAGRSLVLASVVVALTLAAPPFAVAFQATGAGRQSGVSGGVDPGMPETVDAAPGPTVPAATSATTPPAAGGGGTPVTTASTVAASGTVTPAPSGPAAVPFPDPGAAATGSAPSVTLPGTSAPAGTSPAPAPQSAGAEATGALGDVLPDRVEGDSDGELGARSTGASSGPVDSPPLLLVGLAMALGGIAFLAVRNRRTGTFRPIQ